MSHLLNDLKHSPLLCAFLSFSVMDRHLHTSNPEAIAPSKTWTVML